MKPEVMLKSEEIQKAFHFAELAHDGQTRDFSKTPYVSHPKRVARIIQKRGYSKTIVIAAVLHDVLEDTGFNYDDLVERFGQLATNIVVEVSEPSKLRENCTMSREQREAEFLEQLINISMAGKAIKLADILDNTRDFCKYYNQNKERAQRFYFAKMDMLARLHDGDEELYKLAREELFKLHRLLIGE